jgi:nucleoside-diphosphate-sugar epimerase
LADFAPEVFYHLGWIGVGNAHRYDLEQYDNPRQVIDAIKLAAQVGCHRWVGTGSQAEYGPANRRLDEQAPLRPTTLYGAAKVASWALGQILGERLGLRMVWARVFSTYGPGDAAGWMLTDVIGTLLRGGCPALTQGVQLWDYLHVDDAAEALYRLGAAPCAEGVYNLGSGQARTIRSIVETVRDLIDPTLPLGFGEVPYRPDQVMHLEADVTRLRRDVGWEPRVDLETGLADLIASLRAPSGERP